MKASTLLLAGLLPLLTVAAPVSAPEAIILKDRGDAGTDVDNYATRSGWFYGKNPNVEDATKRSLLGRAEAGTDVDNYATRSGWFYGKNPNVEDATKRSLLESS